MTMHRNALPQLSGGMFLSDAGLETTLVFLRGIKLPCFAAYPLLHDAMGRAALKDYFLPFLHTARERGAGFVLDTATWRANADWGAKLGHDARALSDFNHAAVAFAKELREAVPEIEARVVVNGVIGPRGDGYRPEALMTAAQAETYHRPQVADFAASGADMVSAITMNYAEEAIGVARAAKAAGMPSVVSFTVETDGKLATGQPLGQAIEAVDRATGNAPAYYMINCAHPAHFERELEAGGAWLDRVRGLRANASTKSHAELDAATELDRGDPADLARRYRALARRLGKLCVLGGCCGTDHEHVAMIGKACVPAGKTAQPRGF